MENEEKYRVYRQMINSFYEQEQEDEKAIISSSHNVKLEPKLIYNYNSKELKVEFRIGITQMYKIKNLVDFYDNMINHNNVKYGLKLEFIHTRDAFDERSQKILEFVMKYSEIIKYANSSSYYTNFINNSGIVLSNTGIDDFFEAMKGEQIEYENQYGTKTIKFTDTEPKIEFQIREGSSDDDFKITTNINIFDYSILKGKNYVYFLQNDKLYKCSLKFYKTVLRLLEIFKVNLAKEIILKKTEFANLYSLIISEMNNNFTIIGISKDDLKKYLPKELKVKVFLDITKSNFIIANVKFCYDNFEDKNIPRNAVAESKALDLFKNAGFMFDTKRAGLILVNDEKIYDFLKSGIEEFIKRFEVLATDEFKSKQIISKLKIIF